MEGTHGRAAALRAALRIIADQNRDVAKSMTPDTMPLI
jgi:hypothetical protein